METTRDGKPRSPLPPQHQEKPGREKDLRPRPKYEAPQYRAAGKLEGRAALVTGGDSGIGRPSPRRTTSRRSRSRSSARKRP